MTEADRLAGKARFRYLMGSDGSGFNPSYFGTLEELQEAVSAYPLPILIQRKIRGEWVDMPQMVN